MNEKLLENLLPDTREVFNKFSAANLDFLANFVLVGGSALSIRIGHRHSEDLDFFTHKDWFDKSRILSLSNLFKDYEILLNGKEQIDLLCDKVKVSFMNASANSEWRFLSPSVSAEENKIGGINIATIDQLSAMKAYVLFLRSAFRDYYDNYVLSKYHIGLENMYNNAYKYIPGMSFRLFSTALTYTKDIKDENIEYLQPKYKVTKAEIQAYFEKEIKEYIEMESIKKPAL
jgi:predicted nucleotidyltransferase component of viral defense system